MNLGLYIRDSAPELSLEEQSYHLNKYADAHDWTVYKTYTDIGYSGLTTNRPGLQEMIRDVEAGKIDRVVIYRLDRLSRSSKDFAELLENVFIKNNVHLASIVERVDTSTHEGTFLMGILIAQLGGIK